jgi:hypothetical protein
MKHGKISKRTEIMCVHGLYMFFATNLSYARLQAGALMGWGSKLGLQRIYDQPEVEELLEEYVKARGLIDGLYIDNIFYFYIIQWH